MKTPKVLQRKAKFPSTLFKPAAALDPGIVSRLLLLKVLQRRESFRPPFSKGGRVQRQRLWSRSAERETPKPSRQQAPACNASKEQPIQASASKRQQRSPHTEPPTRTEPPPRPEICAGGEMAGQQTNGKGERSLPPFARRRQRRRCTPYPGDSPPDPLPELAPDE